MRGKAKGRGIASIRKVPEEGLLALVAGIGGEGSPGDPYLFWVNFPSFDTVNA
jgi:hypothetical protein